MASTGVGCAASATVDRSVSDYPRAEFSPIITAAALADAGSAPPAVT
ncbi:hypothetical protein [Haloplanus pelagicus]|nr:hypothetical protein [Haloplanus sp. HW8-1]